MRKRPRIFDDLRGILRPLEPTTATVLVPDTNFLIDFGSEPDKWNLGPLGARFTVLLVAEVIREMDKHKRSERKSLQDPARAFGRQPKEWERRADQSGGSIFDGVKVQGETRVAADPTAPNMVGLPSDLSPQVPDDRILASVLNYGRSNPTHALVVLTSDRLMSLKAAKLRIALFAGSEDDGTRSA